MTSLSHSFALQDAMALHQRGAIAEAAARYAEVLRQEPRNVEAMYLLGLASGDLGRFAEAAKLLRKVIKAAPGHAGAHFYLGSALRAQGEGEEAIKSYDRAIRLQPDLAEALFHRGNLSMEAGRMTEAVEAFDRFIALQPQVVEAHVNRANALRGLDRIDEALAGYRAAVELRPDLADTHFSLGLLHQNLCDFEAAIESYDRAVALDPFRGDPKRLAMLYLHRAVARQSLGRSDEAALDFSRAADIAPDFDEVSYAISFFDRAQGRWREAWPKNERRLSFRTKTPRVLQDKPMWSGEPPDSGVLLVRGEEGFGDQVHFACYLPVLAKQGHRVIYWPHDALAPLARGIPGLSGVIVKEREIGGLGPLRWVNLLSLPHIFATTPETIPQTVPYLFAEPARVAVWRQRIAGAGLTVGIHWQGNPKHVQDRVRSMPLSDFKPLADLADVRLFSLQKLPGARQIDDVAFGDRIATPLDPADVSAGALQETAALIEALDLVITNDSLIAHLAGAMGRPVFLALPWIAEWRWLTDRADTPWYPTMRLFRQPERGDWASVFSQLVAAVRERL